MIDHQSDMFEIAMAFHEGGRARDIQLMPMPRDAQFNSRAVVIDTPDGHYLNINEHYAQIIAVGIFNGDDAYRDIAPGYTMFEAIKMGVPGHPDLVGRFVSVRYFREGTGVDLVAMFRDAQLREVEAA